MTGSRLELDNQSKSVYSRKGEELAYLLGNKKKTIHNRKGEEMANEDVT